MDTSRSLEYQKLHTLTNTHHEVTALNKKANTATVNTLRKGSDEVRVTPGTEKKPSMFSTLFYSSRLSGFHS